MVRWALSDIEKSQLETQLFQDFKVVDSERRGWMFVDEQDGVSLWMLTHVNYSVDSLSLVVVYRRCSSHEPREQDIATA